MEEWKDIQGYEGRYQISNLGRIKSLNRKDRLGRNVDGKILKQHTDTNGYKSVMLSKNNDKKRHRIHRLVAKMFIDNPLNLEEVNHIDGDKSNNSKDNLEWVNRKENELHCRKEINNKEYKPFKVCYFNDNIELYDVKSDLADKLKVTSACVKNWLHGKSKGYMNYGIKEIKYL